MTLDSQRRNLYRAKIPQQINARCILQTTTDTIDVRISDISLSGVGFLGFYPELDLAIGDVLTQCRIELPGIGFISCSLCLASQSEQLLTNGLKSIRSGWQFIQLTEQQESKIQRFIFSIE
ncbi:flagellar brake protein [Chitinibacter tainanensis]|uniref:flagellar brake protein n=1 Tax=Chitinibacter tainanensis TaxID=230667 RepID=UPI00235204D1|nr:PilZ domain-containing protein [Chitinibacter tainanensis]